MMKSREICADRKIDSKLRVETLNKFVLVYLINVDALHISHSLDRHKNLNVKMPKRNHFRHIKCSGLSYVFDTESLVLN